MSDRGSRVLRPTDRGTPNPDLMDGPDAGILVVRRQVRVDYPRRHHLKAALGKDLNMRQALLPYSQSRNVVHGRRFVTTPRQGPGDERGERPRPLTGPGRKVAGGMWVSPLTTAVGVLTAYPPAPRRHGVPGAQPETTTPPASAASGSSPAHRPSRPLRPDRGGSGFASAPRAGRGGVVVLLRHSPGR